MSLQDQIEAYNRTIEALKELKIWALGRDERIIAAYKADVGVTEISRTIGLSRTAIYKILDKNGVPSTEWQL
jgi:DNA-binding phage protein